MVGFHYFAGHYFEILVHLGTTYIDILQSKRIVDLKDRIIQEMIKRATTTNR